MKKLLLFLILTFALALAVEAGTCSYCNITMNSPSANGTYNTPTSITFNYTMVGNASIWTCELYTSETGTWAARESDSSVVNNTSDTFTRTGLSDSNPNGYLFNIRCKSTTSGVHDSYVWIDNGTIGSFENWTWIQDNTTPSITVTEPTDRSWDTNGLVPFNYTVVDTNPAQCVFWSNLNITTNTSDAIYQIIQTINYVNNTWFNFSTVNKIDWLDNNSGGYLWNMVCNDSAGHITWVSTTSNYTFFVDTISPTNIKCNITDKLYNNSWITDFDPLFSWNLTTELNFSRYELWINKTDTAGWDYKYNITTRTTGEYTPTTRFTIADGTYWWYIRAYDLAGNSADGVNCDRDTVSGQMIFSTDATCAQLTADQWSLCSIVRPGSINLSDLVAEIGGDTISYLAVYNSSHEFATCTVSGNTCSSNGGVTIERQEVLFIYPNATTYWDDVIYNKSATTGFHTLRRNVNLTNASDEGWNVYGIWNMSGMNFDQILAQIANSNVSGHRTAGMDNKSVEYMSFYNNSASTGSRYVPYVNSWAINNGTWMDFREAVWIYYNGTEDGYYTWNVSKNY